MRHLLFLLLALVATSTGWCIQSGHPDQTADAQAQRVHTGLLAPTSDPSIQIAVLVTDAEISHAFTQPTRGGFEVGSLQLPAMGSSSVHDVSCVAEEDGWIHRSPAMVPGSGSVLSVMHPDGADVRSIRWGDVALACGSAAGGDARHRWPTVGSVGSNPISHPTTEGA